MGFHTFDSSQADRLEQADHRYQFLSAEELLGALQVRRDETVADLGSGTGFYTDDVAPHTDLTYAVDIQPEMHEHYREKGVPDNVVLVTTDVSSLPFEDNSLDKAFSTMTYHEFASDRAIEEIQRVLVPGGRLVIADWIASGSGRHGPPLEERFQAREIGTPLEENGFKLQRVATRPETGLIVASPVSGETMARQQNS